MILPRELQSNLLNKKQPLKKFKPLKLNYKNVRRELNVGEYTDLIIADHKDCINGKVLIHSIPADK